ncbi:putative integral membrane protein [Brugia pahangi]
MRWHCFLFWCGYRFTLAFLAHFNWFTSIYVNCVYFVLWKSYDLLWFWMHLILCICFKPLRARNYLIVWCNLIRKRITVYSNSTYKEIYVLEYGKIKSKRKQKSNNGTNISDGEQKEQDSDDNDQDIDVVEIERTELEELSSQNIEINSALNLAGVIPDEECKCMKQIFLSRAIPSSSSMLRQSHIEVLVPPPRLKKQAANSQEQNREAGAHVPIRGRRNQFVIRNMILNPLKSYKHCGYCVHCRTERHSLDDAVAMENGATGNISNAESRIGLASRIRRYLPLMQDGRDSSSIKDEMDVLTPDFTNKRDLTGAKEILLRQKRDRRMLKKRLRAQKRAELAVIAKYELRQKTISSAVELLLQILQMMTSFAILVGNIRKTFIPAHFSWLKYGRNDSLDLMMLWRCTVFLDVLLFWTSVIWAYCLQWHLCCRLGLLKFWICLLIRIWNESLKTKISSIYVLRLQYNKFRCKEE